MCFIDESCINVFDLWEKRMNDCMGGREKGKIWSRYALSSDYLLLYEKSEVGKQLHMDYFSEKSQPADPPNTLRNILPSISVAIYAKHKCWFIQLTQSHYLSCNHMIHPVFNRIPIQIKDPRQSMNKNIRDLNRGINELKKVYQPRSNLVKDGSGDLLNDSHN
jgi:hypothetical protein